jgi:hypothetical protein
MGEFFPMLLVFGLVLESPKVDLDRMFCWRIGIVGIVEYVMQSVDILGWKRISCLPCTNIWC